MKATLFALFVALLMAGCGNETPSANAPKAKDVDLNDTKVLDKIIAEAIDEEALQFRDMNGEELAYAPNQQAPYSGWGKVTYDNGNIWRVNQYKDGKDDGPSASWYGNGQQKWESTYEDGKPMSIVVWKPNGEKCPASNLVNGNGVWVVYGDSGTEWYRSTYKDGQPVEDQPTPK